jgi:predicted RecB family nuclease
MKQMLSGPLPHAGPGEHCDQPYPCPFKARCWSDVPEHSLWSLYMLRSEKREELEDQGILTIEDLPSDVGLTPIQDRQRRAVQKNVLVVEPGLARALESIEYPIAYLDFETIWPAIPVWDGMRPYDHATVQMSVHIESRDGGLRHHEWLANGLEDPREEAARNVVEFCDGAGTVVVYNIAFERKRLQELREVVPAHARYLYEVEKRLWDLLAVVRNHVYHPGFHGSFGIKNVFPALLPEEAGWEGSTIASGDVASAKLKDLLLDAERFTAEERRDLRSDLLEYCRLDTLAMVLLMAVLRRTTSS